MNKPVAWRTHYPSGWEYKDGNPPFELGKNSELLYIHPVKELTDEEIEELKNALKVCDYKYFGCYAFTDEQWDAFSVLNAHAKAILRKAQEK